jgi:hypothetical protein
MPFFILRGVSGYPVLSGPTGPTPWNDIATRYSNRSEADATHTHLLVHLSPELHSSIKSDCYMIYIKHYAWIPMKKKVPNLCMICVGSVNHSLLVTHVYINRSGLHACCPQTMRNFAAGYTKQNFRLFSNALRCPEEHH